jgi:osmoprotectant transport system permease protein
MKLSRLVPLLLVQALAVGAALAGPSQKVSVGSKAFAESWILGEALAALARTAGSIEVVHRSNLGGTEIVYQALKNGDIDIYPEYTGTIAEVLMKSAERPSLEEMRRALAGEGLAVSDPLGFNDSYALAVLPRVQEELNLYTISDLARHPDLRLSFSHEFIGRKDGYPGLAAHYGLEMTDVRGIQHDLAYTAIASDQSDVIDIYTTDAQIERLGLKILRDDRHFFPRYDAVLLYRLDLTQRAPDAFAAMQRLVGSIDEEKMIRANGLVVLEKRSQVEAGAALLHEALGMAVMTESGQHSIVRRIVANTLAHLKLVAISLSLAILIGIPFGIVATRSRTLSATTLAVAGLFQTIPSLALLAFLIPLVGIGPRPALVALFLYSLLPIVRNTYTGLTTIPPNLSEAAEALGLPTSAQLLRVKIPMASPAILAGIKTSAVINVGTATLAALIGAGGLGSPILQGIALRDNALILQGAIPAAVLALLVQWGFDLLDRVLIPRGLRLSSKPS